MIETVILAIGGLEFSFRPSPAYAHVYVTDTESGGTILFSLQPIRAVKGGSDVQLDVLRRAQAIIELHRQELREAWERQLDFVITGYLKLDRLSLGETQTIPFPERGEVIDINDSVHGLELWVRVDERVPKFVDRDFVVMVMSPGAPIHRRWSCLGSATVSLPESDYSCRVHLFWLPR